MQDSTFLPLLLLSLLHIVGCALAGDKRTLGLVGGIIFGLLPIAGPILILAWPSREEVAYYYWLKKREEQK